MLWIPNMKPKAQEQSTQEQNQHNREGMYFLCSKLILVTTVLILVVGSYVVTIAHKKLRLSCCCVFLCAV